MAQNVPLILRLRHPTDKLLRTITEDTHRHKYFLRKSRAQFDRHRKPVIKKLLKGVFFVFFVVSCAGDAGEGLTHSDFEGYEKY